MKPGNLLLGFFRLDRSNLQRRVFAGISRLARAHPGLRVEQWAEAQLAVPGALQGRHFDGLLIEGAHPVYAALRGHRGPVINFSSFLPESRVPRVVNDQEWAGTIAARYFLSRGFCHFAYCGHPFHHASLLRSRAFRVQLGARGFACAEYSFTTASDEDVAYNSRAERRHLGSWLQRLPAPTALYAFSDRVACVVLECCQDRGIEVPERIALLGTDNDPVLTTQLSPSLSSIDLGSEATGFRAAELLLAWIRTGRRPPPLTTLRNAHIYTRGSTERHAVDHPTVASALDFIAENLARAPDVAAVANAANCSRRTLERLFRQELDRSVHGTVQRLRLERAQKLLCDTTLTLKEIASACGFSCEQHLCTSFRKHLDATPGSLRAQSGATARVRRSA